MAIGAFAGIRLNDMPEGELKAQLRKARRLTAESYSNYEKNEGQLKRLFARVMELSRKEKEWYVYFYAIYERMYLAVRTDDDETIVRYAEIYYRDSDRYMDEALPRYPGTDMAYVNVWIYGFIYNVYLNYCQIDDDKMKLFMTRYEAAALKYGKTFFYYRHEMEMALLYRDPVLMEHGRRGFERYEREMESCYICGHLLLFASCLSRDDPEQAEKLMLDFVNRNIPKKHLWCYQYCEMAEPQPLYAELLIDSLTLGKPQYFRYFLEKYWLKQPGEKLRQRGETGKGYRNLSMYICAIVGNYDDLDYDLSEAQEDLENIKDYATLSKIRVGLMWHCYFELLDRSGVREVPLRLHGEQSLSAAQKQGDASCDEPPAGKDENKIPTLAVSRYMEGIADEWGEKFAGARPQYDYAGVKRTYLECAGLPSD